MTYYSKYITKLITEKGIIEANSISIKKLNEKQNQLIKYNLPSIFLFTIFLQIIVGAFVSGMDAGKVYNTWPLMGSSFFPDDITTL